VHCAGRFPILEITTMTRKAPRARRHDVITLADLAPRQPVVGGSERRVFGSDALVRRAEDAGGKATKNRPARDVRAGKKAR
jgi:hypothetical protein